MLQARLPLLARPALVSLFLENKVPLRETVLAVRFVTPIGQAGTFDKGCCLEPKTLCWIPALTPFIVLLHDNSQPLLCG